MSHTDRHPIFFDHVCALLANHNYRRVGITADYGGHYRRIHHPEAVNTMHPESGVDHGVRIGCRAHLARARRMVYGKREVPKGALPVLVAEQFELLAARHGRKQRPGVELAERGRVGHIKRDPDALDKHLHVLAVRKVVGFDDRVHQRVFTLESQPTGALGP